MILLLIINIDTAPEIDENTINIFINIRKNIELLLGNCTVGSVVKCNVVFCEHFKKEPKRIYISFNFNNRCIGFQNGSVSVPVCLTDLCVSVFPRFLTL